MPYGRGFVDLKLPTKNLRVIRVKEPRGLADEEKSIKEALENPIKKPPLPALADSQDKVTIIVDDITRPTPSHKIVSAILEELPVPSENVTVLVATGLHRKNTERELEAMLGKDILSRVRVVNHDAFDEGGLVYVGETSMGTKLEVNRLVADADLLITTGHIEPHEFAGFTGGRKSILPGVAGVEGINHNHRLENLDHPRARIGILDGNPIHEDMVEAARMVEVDFMVNVVLNSEKRVTKVVAGDVEEAHRHGVAFYREHAQVEVGEPADIVIASSGYPGDINFYQSIKSCVIPAEPFVKEGGVIIALAGCEDGFGGELFFRWMTSFSSPDDIVERFKREGYRADLDHCYLLARVLKKCEVVVVTPDPSVHKIRKSLIKTTSSPEDAIKMALNRKGKDASILALPYAQRVIPKY